MTSVWRRPLPRPICQPAPTLLVELGEVGCLLARVGADMVGGELEREVKVDGDKVKVIVRKA